MTTFASAITNREARTENNMKARASTANSVVDLFYKIGGLRGQNPIPAFEAAMASSPDLAVRVALWARDAREGAGERESFRRILKHLDKFNPDVLTAILHKVPELGRWDDLLVIENTKVRPIVVDMIRKALNDGNGLAAKWMPREKSSSDWKSAQARKLRKELGLSARQYRKLLVSNTKVVEQDMCAKNWDKINFSHVPSLAAARYKNAFLKNAKERYEDYLSKLASGDKSVKVNASAVFPHDVMKDFRSGKGADLIRAQWDALPNYVGDKNILPIVDTSGSMTMGEYGAKTTFTPADVAFSLGVYLADKNKGPFKDCFLTFNSVSNLYNLKGDVISKFKQMATAPWGGSTNLHSAFDTILNTARKANVPASEMPDVVLILSDMQFNQCVRFDDSAIQMIQRKYSESGYEMPTVIFWNLRDAGNTPVQFNEKGVGLVSGFSPAIVKNILGGKNLTPYDLMLDTIMNPRYDF